MSNLLKMHLATQSRHLKQRVQAALVNLAQQQKNADNHHGLFARIVLSDITKEWPEFILATSADPTIQEALVLGDDNAFVVTTLVKDEHIIEVVEATYWETADKYAPQPDNDGQEEDGEPS